MWSGTKILSSSQHVTGLLVILSNICYLRQLTVSSLFAQMDQMRVRLRSLLLI